MGSAADILRLGAQLTDWLRNNAPGTARQLLRPSVAASSTSPATGTGDELLDAYFSLDFATAESGNYGTMFLPPSVTPCSLAGALELSQGLVEDWNPEAEVGPQDIAVLEQELAGTSIAAWLPDVFTFVALVGRQGGLFVDNRSGAQHGCIMQWERDNAALGGVFATDLVEYLDTALSALRNRTGAYGAEMTLADDGTVHWQ